MELRSSMMKKVNSQQEKEKAREDTDNPFSKGGDAETILSEGQTEGVALNAIDSFDVSKQMNSIEQSLLNKGFSYEQRMLLEQIAGALDSYIKVSVKYVI